MTFTISAESGVDECGKGACINAVPGKDLGAQGLHRLYFICIEHRYILASLHRWSAATAANRFW